MSFRPLVYSLAASIALNTSGLLLVQRSFERHAQRVEVMKQEMRAKAARDNIFFDFVDSPSALQPQSARQKPRRIPRMLERKRDRKKGYQPR